MKTPLNVIFRKFKEGDIIALFPELPGTRDPGTCESYMHMGQHGAASVRLTLCTKPATPHEYRPLLQELRRIYDNCDLIVSPRVTVRDTKKRLAALQR